jgi:hypothetical protein
MTAPVTRHPDLLSWLQTQVDTDERFARAFPDQRQQWLTAGGWAETGPQKVLASDGYLIVDGDATAWAEEIVYHVARHDPRSCTP